MLKIGDTFTQFGYTYQVVGENEAGLISKRVEGVEIKAEKPEVEAPKRRTRKTTEI